MKRINNKISVPEWRSNYLIEVAYWVESKIRKNCPHELTLKFYNFRDKGKILKVLQKQRKLFTNKQYTETSTSSAILDTEMSEEKAPLHSEGGKITFKPRTLPQIKWGNEIKLFCPWKRFEITLSKYSSKHTHHYVTSPKLKVI